MPILVPGGLVIHSDDIHIWTEDDALHIGSEEDAPNSPFDNWEVEDLETDVGPDEIVEELSEE